MSILIKQISDADDHQRHDDDIQFLTVRTDERPVAAEAIAEVGEEGVPERGAENRVEREDPDVHSGGAGRKGDEVADDRNETGDEDGFLSESPEEIFREVEMVDIEQQIFAVFDDERTAEIHTDVVGYERADDAAERAEEDDRFPVHLALVDEEARERHHCFTGDRGDHTFQHHQEGEPQVAGI